MCLFVCECVTEAKATGSGQLCFIEKGISIFLSIFVLLYLCLYFSFSFKRLYHFAVLVISGWKYVKISRATVFGIGAASR